MGHWDYLQGLLVYIYTIDSKKYYKYVLKKSECWIAVRLFTFCSEPSEVFGYGCQLFRRASPLHIESS